MGKSSKLRVSQHSGREGSAKHNDRSFLTGRSDAWIREHADHIDITKTDSNLILTWDDGQDIEASERAWYAQAYGEAQEATNARYRHEGHADRCKTTDQLYEGKQSRPEEMILQIGDMTSGIDPEAFRQTAEDYLRRLYKSCGEHMHLLSIALHYDEASPHAHVRRVWDYTDRDGLTRPGQDKALEAMGVALPDPSKPKGRYNNRKMTFDKAARELWQEVCRAHGFDIETEPRPDRRHKDKADFIRDQIAQEIDQAKQQAQEATQQAIEAQKRAAQADKEAKAYDIGLEISKSQALQASQEAEKAHAKAKAAQTAQKQAAELLEATRDDLRGTTESLDAARQELAAVEQRTRILTAAEVDQQEQEHQGFMGRVMLSESAYTDLVRTARTAEEAVKRAQAIEAERAAIVQQAQTQAAELIRQAVQDRDKALQDCDKAKKARDGYKQDLRQLRGTAEAGLECLPDWQDIQSGIAATKLIGLLEYRPKSVQDPQPSRLTFQVIRALDKAIAEIPRQSMPEILQELQHTTDRIRSVQTLSIDRDDGPER